MPVNLPDFVVTDIGLPAVMVQGGRYNFSYVVKNTGTLSSGTSDHALKIDAVPNYRESYLTLWSTDWVPDLAPGEAKTLLHSVDTTNLSLGQHTIWIALDNWGEVTESSEVNNLASATFTVTAVSPPSPQPDLVVSSLTADASVAYGQNYSFSYAIGNVGPQSAGISHVSYRVGDTFSAPTFSDSELISPLSAGSTTQTITHTINTAALAEGEFTVWVTADSSQEVAESSEANNLASITFTVTGPLGADLAVNGITAPSSVAQGANLDFSYVIKNSGSVAVGGSYAAYRVDQIPDVANWIAYNQVAPLNGGSSAALNASFSTANLSVGQHTLYVAADNWNSVSEVRELNNLSSITFTVTAPVRADLVVSSIAAGSVSQGANLDFSYVVQNTGLAAAGQSYAAFRVDQMPDVAHWIAYNSVNPLAASGSETINASFNTAGLSVGTHTLWVAADNWSYVGEGSETNNWTSVSFDVTAPVRADLVVSSITAGSVSQGTNLDFSYVVQNSGLGSAGLSYAAYRVDQMPDVAHWISYNLVDPLAASASETINASFNTASLSVGTHTLWVAADNWSYVGEGSETNNWTSVSFDVTAPVRADLVVSSITAGSVS
ncbi:MAG: CARDB domain-containing protein, partial [Reyranella sp.]|nr:CARDB domain-containing protein [Reyranella sp.]